MRNAGALLARPTPARPGPGPMAEGLLRALDVSIGRRVEGLLAGDFRSNLLGTGIRARDDAPVRRRGRRAPDRLERHGAHRRAARPRRPRRARARDVARARHVGLDAVRHGRPAEGRRRGRRRRRDRPPRDAAREPARRRRVRRRGVSRDPAAAGTCRARRAAHGAPEPSHPPDGPGASTLGEALAPSRRARPPALARRRRLGLPRLAGVAPTAPRARRAP